MSAGLLRIDLYYRLNVVSIEIPPLRERPEDLTPLIRNFVTRLGRDPSGFLSALKKHGLLRDFEQYSWPGNVGELKTLVDTLALGEKWDDARDFLRARSQISAHRSVQRVIEFLPEYHQAGVSILSFFGEVLRRKYSNYKGIVRIEQDGLKVKMIIEPITGELEIFEQALDEYGLVISGKITAEQFTEDPYLVISLKHELRMAQARIESQKELLSYQDQRLNEKERLVADFMRMVGQTLHMSKTPDIRIEISPTISADNRTNFNLTTSVDVISEKLITLAQVFAANGDKQDELHQIRNELQLLKSKNADSFKQAPVMTRLRKLIEQISEAESNVGKLFKSVEAGVSTVQTIAKYYNDIAGWCGLPQVPKPLLGNSEKS